MGDRPADGRSRLNSPGAEPPRPCYDRRRDVEAEGTVIMGILSVLAAAAASWLFGAVWYMALSRPWMAASGVPLGANGAPLNAKNPAPYLFSAVAMLFVAGMMRHMLVMAGLSGALPAGVTGLGVGLFFVAPWIAINNAYAMRPARLTLIDGGYAVIGCTLIGLVLGVFAAGQTG